MPILKIDGQELELDEAMAASDELLRQGLAPFYPFMQNVLIERKTDKDGQLVIAQAVRWRSQDKRSPLPNPINCTVSCLLQYPGCPG